MGWGYGYGFRPYVSVAQKRAEATKHIKSLQKQGKVVTPVAIEGRTITRTFWADSWCEHIESYRDFAHRLERGRSYVRGGMVAHLAITPGKIEALVSGSSLYNIAIEIQPLAPKKWDAIRRSCQGKVGSLIELLQGKLDKQVMQIVTHRDTGLFPAPHEIKMKCDCPDYAGLCKHLAAVLYGIGARLDHEPDLLFTLRQVDHLQLIEQIATNELAAPAGEAAIADAKLGDIFGIEMDPGEAVPEPDLPPAKPKRPAVKKKPARSRLRAMNLKTMELVAVPAKPKRTAVKKKPPRWEHRALNWKTMKPVEIPAKTSKARSKAKTSKPPDKKM